ncbi:MAG: TonB-dependent receptor, partial [Xanthomonadales bacterium]
EVVVVTGVRIHDELRLESSRVAQTGLDNSDLMRMFPGGNRNANGPLTRISQYRGLFGAQNSVAVDGAGYSADCPNWMDSPLSSIPQALTESVTLYRGLGSVETVREGLGGAIEIRSRGGDFADTEGWSAYGNAALGYGENASALNASVVAGLHDAANWLNVAASLDRGDDYGFDGGTVAATEYDRAQYRLGYGRRLGDGELVLRATVNRTGESGTPALPMDMRYLDSEQYAVEWTGPLGAGSLHLAASTLSVEHVMDNFTLRPPPLNRMGKPMFRESAPLGDTDQFEASWRLTRDSVTWVLGADGQLESHDHPLADPTNPAFHVTNFNGVSRDRIGGFVNAITAAAAWELEAGLRYNRVRMNAGEVGGNLALPPASPMYVQQQRLDALAAEFNAADRRVGDDQWIGLLKASRDLGDAVRLNLGLGRKARSPSYQERYLWLPLTATAGLADGWNYIGDIGLEPETSLEVTAGIDFSGERFRLTPEVFYRDVDDFIQGTPSTNETANRYALMATGRLPLQYGNVDAELYGFDLGYEWRIAEPLVLRGTLSYVRGKRTDAPDNLYRIAPLTSFVELIYQAQRYFLAVESLAAARQDDVAAYNAERPTSGWGIVNLRGAYELNGAFTLGAGVENLFDTVYQDHLGGYNRVRESDIAVGDRINGMGRNVYLRLNARW